MIKKFVSQIPSRTFAWRLSMKTTLGNAVFFVIFINILF